jgi:hypothetical protein
MHAMFAISESATHRQPQAWQAGRPQRAWGPMGGVERCLAGSLQPRVA